MKAPLELADILRRHGPAYQHQNLVHHPHLHCVIAGGGLAADGTRWVACRPGFFPPVRVLSRLFHRLFLERSQHAFDIGALRFFASLVHLSEPGEFSRYLSGPRQTEWVVYAKEPFGGPQRVLDYLVRYTHRVGISNNRLISQSDRHVTFRWKGYHHPGRSCVMRLDAHEFQRRLLLHVLAAYREPEAECVPLRLEQGRPSAPAANAREQLAAKFVEALRPKRGGSGAEGGEILARSCALLT